MVINDKTLKEAKKVFHEIVLSVSIRITSVMQS